MRRGAAVPALGSFGEAQGVAGLELSSVVVGVLGLAGQLTAAELGLCIKDNGDRKSNTRLHGDGLSLSPPNLIRSSQTPVPQEQTEVRI